MNSSSFDRLQIQYFSIQSRIQSLALKRSSHPEFAEKNSITLIAASKGQDIKAIESLYHLGHRDFGENYVQEMCTKAAQLHLMGITDIRWHFIGHLQRNKVRDLIPWVFCIHSVDSLKLAAQIQKEIQKIELKKPLPIFIETNIDREETKSGVQPEETKALAESLQALKDLNLLGLMAIPAPQNSSLSFQKLKDLEESLGGLSHRQLSMGMSDDFETAILHGATHVRIGTALFGARAPKKN